MSTGTILLIAAAALIVLAAVLLFTTTARRDRASAVGYLARETRKKDRSDRTLGEPAEEAHTITGREIERAAVLAREDRALAPLAAPPPALRQPLDPDAYGVTRRQFLNRGLVTFMTLGLAGFGTTTIAFLWPTLSAGFGAKIRAGKLTDLLATIRDTKEPVYISEGRMYITAYPRSSAGAAGQAYTGGVLDGMREGVVALYQKCPHLGCRVPWCKTSQWFECPCHGSQYNRVGEKKGGPAPRGMDRFPVSIAGGVVTVDTGTVVQGPPIGTDTTGQQPEGPHCA
jgi:cytochrome b6-f complex iron-sulfur subunit